jgi:hypothetical protein
VKNYWLERKQWKRMEIFSNDLLIKNHWDFAIALGDIIREKYESKYIKVLEIKNVCNRKVR